MTRKLDEKLYRRLVQSPGCYISRIIARNYEKIYVQRRDRLARSQDPDLNLL